MSYKNYKKSGNISGNKTPVNTHLLNETPSTGIYFVDSENNKNLIKTVDLTGFELVTSRNKDIARSWQDYVSGIIHYLDSEYDQTVSYVWKIEPGSDDVSEVQSIPADVFDIWRYANETYVYYFESGAGGLEEGVVVPNEDVSLQWSPGGTHWNLLDDYPDHSSYIYTTIDGQNDDIGFTTTGMTGYDNGTGYEIEVEVWGGIYSGGAALISISGNIDGMTGASLLFDFSSNQSVIYSDLTFTQNDLDNLNINIHNEGFPFGAPYVSAIAVTVRFYGDVGEYLTIKNLDTAETWKKNMGLSQGRTYESSQVCIAGAKLYYLWKWSDENAELWHFDYDTTGFTQDVDCGANTDLAGQNQRAIAWDGDDKLYFVLKDTSDNNKYLHEFQISTTGLTKKGIYDIALMLNRNCSGANYEKAFDMTGSKIYQIDSSYEYLLNIAKVPLESDERIVGITDNYLFVSGAS